VSRVELLGKWSEASFLDWTTYSQYFSYNSYIRKNRWFYILKFAINFVLVDTDLHHVWCGWLPVHCIEPSYCYSLCKHTRNPIGIADIMACLCMVVFYTECVAIFLLQENLFLPCCNLYTVSYFCYSAQFYITLWFIFIQKCFSALSRCLQCLSYISAYLYWSAFSRISSL
jgi:hypothetical protein